MKSKFLKQFVSMLMVVLTIMSVMTISANAEELLPEPCGGATYDTDEEPTPETNSSIPAITDGSMGGAIYSDGEVVMPDITFTNNIDIDANNGGAIYSDGEVVMPDITFTNNIGIDANNGGAIYSDGEVVMPDITFTNNIDTNNGSAICNPGEAVMSDVTSDSFTDTDNDDGGAISNDIDIAPVQDETDIQSQPDTENQDDTEIPAQIEITPDSTANSDAPVPPITAEIPDDNTSDPIGMVAGIDIVGKAIPQPPPDDPEIEEIRGGKNAKITKTVGDAIVKIGESVIPFGPTISNFIRSRSPQGKDMDKAETAIDLIADTAAYAFPIAAPLVSVGKDIVLKIRRLFG